MSVGMDQIRDKMTRYLTEHQISAVSAWPDGERLSRSGAVVSVSLRKCQGGPSGFQDYLGERLNRETGQWEELYGKRVKLTFGLDLYADAQEGESALERAFDQLAEALQESGPEGLELEEFSCGETTYRSADRLLKRPVQAVYRACLYAVAQPGGAFVDFEIRGGMRQ